MPTCTFIKDYDLSPENGSLKVVVTYAGNTEFSFSDIIEAAFGEFEVSRGPRTEPSFFRGGDLQESFHVKGVQRDLVDGVSALLELLKRHISIEDTLDECHALAPRTVPDKQGGWPRTKIGQLVYQAKDYRGQQAWKDTPSAKQICRHIHTFIDTHPRYRQADVLIPTPSSDPEKTNTLPSAVASAVSHQLGQLVMLPRRVTRIPPLKQYDETESTIPRDQVQIGTIAVDEDFQGETVVLLDDFYQEGTTLKELARVCRNNGAGVVLGLAMTKNAKSTRGMDLTEWPWG